MADEHPDPSVPRWLELGFYAAVAVAGVGPALWRSTHVVGDGVDLYGTLWFYWWIQDCLVQLNDPGFTDLFFHPLGKDIFAHTGDNFIDALLSVPFQWIFRFPRYQPVFVAVILVGNALAFRPLAARFAGSAPGQASSWWRRALGGGRSTTAAFLATGLWQASAFALFEITAGRPTQAFLWFLPLAVDRFLALEDSPARRRDAVLAGVFTALQALTYWFMGHFMALLFLWLAAWALLRSPRRRGLVLDYALAGASALALAAPFVLAMANKASVGAVPGLVEGSGLLSSPAALLNSVATQLHGYWLMEIWGAPMLGYVTWIAAILLVVWRGPDRLRWVGALLLLLVMAVGPSLPLTGGARLDWWPYLLAYNTVPFLDRLWFPYRLVVVVFLLLAACTGAAARPLLARLASSPRPLLARHGALGAALLILAFNLAEQGRQLCYPFITRDVDPPRIYSWIGKQGGGLLHLPFGINQPSIIWQTVHHQPLFGGMGENAPLLWPVGFKKKVANEYVRFLRGATRRPESTESPATDLGLRRLRKDGFRWVLLHRELVDTENRDRKGSTDRPRSQRKAAYDPDRLETLPFAATERISQLLGPPVAVDGPVVIWDLQGGAQPPAELSPTEQNLTTRSWEALGPPAYESLLRSQGRLPEAQWTPRDHQPGRPQ